MPRDNSGNYQAPGNPQEAGGVITSSWANNLMDDIEVAMTDSLDRNGRGGMLAPFENADGTGVGPGITFSSEPSTGFYRAGLSDVRFSLFGADLMRLYAGELYVWDSTSTEWNPVLTNANIGLDSGTADGQSIRWDAEESKYSPTSNIMVDTTGLSTWIGSVVEGIQVYGIGQGKTFIAASEKDDAIGDATKELNIAATSIDVQVDDSFRVKAGGDFNFQVSDNGKITVGEWLNVAAMLGVQNTGGEDYCLIVRSSDNNNKLGVREDGAVGINNAGITGYPLTVLAADGSTKRLEVTEEGEVSINGNHADGVALLVYDKTGTYKRLQVNNDGDIKMPAVYNRTSTNKPNVYMASDGRLYRSTNTWT